ITAFRLVTDSDTVELDPADTNVITAGVTSEMSTSPSGVEHVLVWDTSFSAPISTANAHLDIEVSDGHLSSAIVSSPTFELRNQTPPRVGALVARAVD